MRNCHTISHSDCTVYIASDSIEGFPVLHSYQHLLFLFLWIIDVLTGIRGQLTVVLICIPLMINGVEHLFECLLTIYISSLEKFCSHLLSILKFGLFVSCGCRSSLYILAFSFFLILFYLHYGLFGIPRWLRGKESACQYRRHGFSLWVRKIPWRRQWQPTPVFSAGKSCGQRTRVGYSPWDHRESNTTEGLSTVILALGLVSFLHMGLFF